MDRLSALFDQFLGTGPDGRRRTLDEVTNGRGDLAKGAAAGGLAGLLLGTKGGRKLTGNALKVGGLAVVGGLAYKAWRARQAERGDNVSSDAHGRFLPDDPAMASRLNRHLVSAMIAAAKADGTVTDREWAAIEGQTESLGLGGEDRAFVAGELARPLNVGEIAALAGTPEEAAEIYAASLLVIDRHGPAEQGYLAMLAARLGLEPQLVTHLEAEADALDV